MNTELALELLQREINDYQSMLHSAKTNLQTMIEKGNFHDIAEQACYVQEFFITEGVLDGIHNGLSKKKETPSVFEKNFLATKENFATRILGAGTEGTNAQIRAKMDKNVYIALRDILARVQKQSS